MIIRRTEEELKLEAIFEPYLEKGRLREDAPQAAKRRLRAIQRDIRRELPKSIRRHLRMEFGQLIFYH